MLDHNHKKILVSICRSFHAYSVSVAWKLSSFHANSVSVWPPKHKHRFCHHHFSFIINLNLILNFYIISASLIKMVRTRSQLENLSKEELIEELITVEDISSKLSDLSNRFNDFLRRFEVVSSDIAIARNCNKLTIIKL